MTMHGCWAATEEVWQGPASLHSPVVQTADGGGPALGAEDVSSGAREEVVKMGDAGEELAAIDAQERP